MNHSGYDRIEFKSITSLTTFALIGTQLSNVYKPAYDTLLIPIYVTFHVKKVLHALFVKIEIFTFLLCPYNEISEKQIFMDIGDVVCLV